MQSAAAQGQLERLRLLIDAGADLDFRDETGDSALHHAVRGNHEDCVELLLKNGADINLENQERETPLYVAAKLDYMDLVRTLLRWKASLVVYLYRHWSTRPNDTYRTTLLHWACAENRTALVDVLLAFRVSTDLTNDMERTPMSYATIWGTPEIMKKLLKHGAVVNTIKHPPLFTAMQATEVQKVRSVEARVGHLNATHGRCELRASRDCTAFVEAWRQCRRPKR